MIRPSTPALLAALAACALGSACGADSSGDPSESPTAPPQATPTEGAATPTDPQATPTADGTPTARATPTDAQATPTDPQATPTAAPTPTALPARSYSARLRYTSYGIPHILADDMGSAGFGEGFALARAHGCTLADQILKVRSERARYFGPGDNDRHIDSDLGWLHLGVMDAAAKTLPTLEPGVRDAIYGFASGYNHFLATEGSEALEPWCAGQPWVRPITPVELMAYYISLAGMSSTSALIPGIARAQPPGAAAVGPLPPMPDFRALGLASNGWAIGGDVSESGRGMLAANPHFPWEGELRFFQSQVTVPGVANVFGGSLLGSSAINIGFNEHVAWTHTVSPASRMTFYRLTLERGDPTRYRYDGRFRDMEATEYTIQVLGEDGRLTPLRRTLYKTHWGPMVATGDAGWSANLGLTLRDANELNIAMLPQFFGMNAAQSLEGFEAVHREVQGIPWVNTIAADSDGDALYVDASAVPNLSEASITAWLEALDAGDPLTLLGWSLGVPLLDGSTSDNEWVEDPAAARPGIIPYDDAPRLLRRDYAFNANDSHWLSNVHAPLEGFSPLYGGERTPRSTRTRMNATMLEEIRAAALEGGDRLSLEELQAAMVSNRGKVAELLADAVPERCDGLPVNYGGGPVDISAVCAAIASWDRRYDLDSQGAAAWREFVGAFDSAALYDAGDLFEVPFDPADPVGTPRGLAPAATRASDPILQALAAATVALQTAGIEPDAPLGEIQYTPKGELNIPIHGGADREGCYNVVTYTTSTLLITSTEPHVPRGEEVHGTTDLTDTGYVINYGTSLFMAVEFTDDGPRARGWLTYSQAGDETAEHGYDQTQAFSEKRWLDIPFTEEEILADPNYREEIISTDGGDVR